MRDIQQATIDITAPDFSLDPIDGYNRLRRTAPISWQLGARGFLLTRYADVSAAFRHPDFQEPDLANGWRKIGVKTGKDFSPALRLFQYLPFIHEGARHRQLRGALARAVAPFANATGIFDAHVGRSLAGLGRQGGFDLMDDFANGLVFEIFCDLMQVPPEERPAIRPLSQISWALEATLSVRRREETSAIIARCMPLLTAHAARTLEKRQETLLSAIYRSLPPGEPEPVSAAAHLAAVMIVMGNDALSGTLGFSVRRLLKDPRSTPQPAWESIWADALRYAAPVDFQNRIAQRDAEVAGCPFRKGDRLILSPLAANHDAKVAEADADVIRPRASLGYGLTFGAGAHVCVGAKIASAIMRSAFRGLASLPPMTLLDDGKPGPGKVIRTLSSLPVQLH
jgi:unspecific monooxygenase